MKPALYYAVARDHWLSSKYRPIAVTTVKTRQIYGRFVLDDHARHWRPDDIIGRFDTADEAIKLAHDISAVHALYLPLFHEIDQRRVRLTRERDEAIKGLIAQKVRQP